MPALILFLALAAAAQSTDPAVKASWKTYSYSGPQFRGYECADAERALRSFLTQVKAKDISASCQWRSGLWASWRGLAPVSATPKGKVDNFLSLQGLSLVSAPDEAVSAAWTKTSFQEYISGPGRACNIHADVYGYLLDTVALRNVSYYISCGSGTGVLNLSFDYLAASASSASKY